VVDEARATACRISWSSLAKRFIAAAWPLLRLAGREDLLEPLQLAVLGRDLDALYVRDRRGPCLSSRSRSRRRSHGAPSRRPSRFWATTSWSPFSGRLALVHESEGMAVLLVKGGAAAIRVARSMTSRPTEAPEGRRFDALCPPRRCGRRSWMRLASR
jgi:hypothetical protein